MADYTAYHCGTSGQTYYAKPLPLTTATWGTDAQALTENGTTGQFAATITDPADYWLVYQQSGDDPAASDLAVGLVSFLEDKIAAKTANLPASPAAVGDVPTAAQNRQEMDANSTRLADIDTQSLSAATNALTAATKATAIQAAMLDGQDVADALLLAPSGTAADGSAMAKLAALVEVAPDNKPAVDGDGAVKVSETSLGGDLVTLTLTDSATSQAIAGAEVWVSTDAGGATRSKSKITNSVGEVTFSLTNGSTYYRWAKYDGTIFVNGVSFVASKD